MFEQSENQIKTSVLEPVPNVNSFHPDDIYSSILVNLLGIVAQAIYDAPTLSDVLKSRGVTDEQFALILIRNPDIVNYSTCNEIIPRLNYMDYLYEKGVGNPPTYVYIYMC
jgi:hypothetical protein